MGKKNRMNSLLTDGRFYRAADQQWIRIDIEKDDTIEYLTGIRVGMTWFASDGSYHVIEYHPPHSKEKAVYLLPREEEKKLVYIAKMLE